MTVNCPVCQEGTLEVFFEGGRVPLFVNVLFPSRDEALAAATGEMRLACCGHCGFISNVGFDPELVRYAPGYENSLHGSPTFQAWAAELARGLAERHGLAGGRAVEIGGGRGEFMSLLLEAGAGEGLVMDPSAPDDALSTDERLRIERRLFEAGDASGARLLLTRHVLEHLDDPNAFIGLLAGAARDAGAGLYVEVPSGNWTIRDLGIWDLIYEHCSYFTPGALRTLMARHGAGCTMTETYGGQFLSAECAAVGAPGAASTGNDGPETRALCAAFAAEEARARGHWQSRFDELARRGETAVIWGAGSKGATFLNRIEGSREVCPFAVDVNERKHGGHVPGSGHQVVGPEALTATEAAMIIAMNPRYLAEIESMARAAGSAAEVVSVADTGVRA